MRMASGHYHSSRHHMQEADRDSCLHSNWGRWFHREEVDSSTSNRVGSDTGPHCLLLSLSTPVYVPSLQESETLSQTPLLAGQLSSLRLRQQKPLSMDSHKVLLATTYLLGTLGESLLALPGRILGHSGVQQGYLSSSQV